MFSASQEKVEQGLRFQKEVFDSMKSNFSNVVDTRDYFSCLNPNAPDVFLNLKESQNGDIMVGPLDQDTFHLECITSSSETIFPETKLRNFSGNNHFYIFRLVEDGSTHVVHSKVWNSYISKCPKVVINNRKYRKFKSRNISGLRSKSSIQQLINLIGEKHD